ncbi:MAG: hypothetical protein QXN37_04210 [Candidatus Anstonellaceae archaeon]
MGKSRRGKKEEIGKKAVYMTQYKNAALEVAKMYERKGEKVEIEKEYDQSGAPIYVVYIFLKGIL